MTGLLEYVGLPPGPERTAWLNRQLAPLERGLAGLLHYVPPELRPMAQAAPGAFALLSPGADFEDARAASGETWDAARQGDPVGTLAGLGGIAAAGAGVFLPGSASGYRKGADDVVEGIRAYHGSPHDFDKFSLDHIGTGEGAQAYGHGLYFAENEDVARSYRDALAPSQATAVQRVTMYGDDMSDSLARARERVAFYESKPQDAPRRDTMLAIARQNLKGLEELASGAAKKPGHMYEVNINARPEDFLDWDAPLSAQPEAVRAFAADRGIAMGEPDFRWNGYDGHIGAMTPQGAKRKWATFRDTGSGIAAKFKGEDLGTFPNIEAARAAAEKRIAEAGYAPDVRGKDIYSALSGAPDGMTHVDTAPASRALLEAGVPGIRYLDGGSRGVGEGSRNYVAFDDNIIDILRKYGLAGLTAGGAAMGMNAFAQQPSEAQQ